MKVAAKVNVSLATKAMTLAHWIMSQAYDSSVMHICDTECSNDGHC